MALTQIINGQAVQLGQTRPSGLEIGQQNPNRKLMLWNIPNKGLVQMYVNPESFSITESKLLKETRTKGGYMIQYWGQNLPVIDLSGTTGSGGIEGINVLHDIYLQEQQAFADVIAQVNSGFLNNLVQATLGTVQSLSNNPISDLISTTSNTLNTVSNLFSDVVNTVGNIANIFDVIGTAIGADNQLLPTLGALALSVELHFDGVIYRGFFTEFRVDEKSQELGLFRYSMKFKVTRRTGVRLNGFAWQRTVNSGPANSDVIPLNWGALSAPAGNTTTIATPPTVATPPNVNRRSLLTGG